MSLTLPRNINEYYGSPINTLPPMMKTGAVPLSVASIMKLRLQLGDNFPHLWGYYFDTSDFLFYPKNNTSNVYCLLSTNNKNQITPNGKTALEQISKDLDEQDVEIMRKLYGNNFIKIPRRKVTSGRYLYSSQINKEKLLRLVSRHPEEVPEEFAEDGSLLNEYVNELELRTKSSKNMPIFIADTSNQSDYLNFIALTGIGQWSGVYSQFGPRDDDRFLSFIVSNLEQILNLSNMYVPLKRQEEFRKEISLLYSDQVTRQALVKKEERKMEIDDLQLSIRCLHVFERMGIKTIGELLSLRAFDLLEFDNFGKKSLEEVKAELKRHGLSLKK